VSAISQALAPTPGRSAALAAAGAGSSVTPSKGVHAMQTAELKTDCMMEKDGQTFEVLLHLIEIRYNERIVFWNGVVSLTDETRAKVGTVKPMEKVGILLPDGRRGCLMITHAYLTENYYEVAGVGNPNG
jgi:hypothetical protein